VPVRVDESGDDAAAAEVDDPGVGTGERPHDCVRADRDDPVTFHGDRLGMRRRRIRRPHPRIHEDEVR
jgi:hypothetical protein